MKKKLLLFLVFTLLTFLMLTRAVRAQFTTGISLGVSNPMRCTYDSVPGIRPGLSFNINSHYVTHRISMNVTVGYVSLNTANGFETLARQNGYTSEKGFVLSTRSGGQVNLSLGAGYNVLPVGVTDCGLARPSLFVGAGVGIWMTAGKIDGEAKTKAGETAFTLQQTGGSTTPYYLANAELLYPMNHILSLVTGATWSRGMHDLSLQRSNNGNNGVNHFTYSDLQVSIGVQVAFKGIQEKGVKRAQAVALPSVDGTGEPQARTSGSPIGGIVVKGGQNPTGKPKPNAMVEGQPIGGIVVKGGQNPGSKPKPHAMVAGNPIPGVVIKGGVNAMVKGGKLVYEEDLVVDNPALLNYLGVDELVIAKGEYPVDESGNAESKVIVHLHSQQIVHRDLAARSFVFEGTDHDGQTFTYSIEPLYEKGVAKEILVTYKGISEKGIK